MKNFLVVVVGVAVNIFLYIFFQDTRKDINMVVPKIYLLFILPLFVIMSIGATIAYDYAKKKGSEFTRTKWLVFFTFLMMVLQYLFFSNEVLVK
jgi:hypothetical protein